MIEGAIIKDMDVQFVKLDYGTYLVDGKVATGDALVPCKHLDDIRKVTMNRVIDYYIKEDKEISCEEYNRLLEEVEEEDRYSFKEKYTPIYKEVQTISEPIKLEVHELVEDTHIPFVKSAFLNGESNNLSLMVYHRESAIKHWVREVGNQLGLTEIDHYNCGTDEYCIAGSGISCYIISGKLMFNDIIDSQTKVFGSLSTLKEMSEQDRLMVRDRMTLEYNLNHKGNNFELPKELRNELESARYYLNKVQSLKRTQGEYYTSLGCIDKALQLLAKAGLKVK